MEEEYILTSILQYLLISYLQDLSRVASNGEKNALLEFPLKRRI